MSEEIERTLCQLPQVHVFKIPSRKSADGHRASDWPKDPTWTGKVKIVAKGTVAAIILLDEKNQVFAVCQVNDDSAVERTLDSGRYYVLRITNSQGKHAFIGIAFNERNDAFDFNVTLSEFKNEVERENKASKMSELPEGPMQDLSLKDGEKIKIKINLRKNHTVEGDEVPSADYTTISKPKINGGGAGGKSLLLPPPKRDTLGVSTSTSKIKQPVPVVSDSVWTMSSDPFQSTSTVQTSSDNSDPFGSSFSFVNTSSSATSNPNTQTKSTAKSSNEVTLLDF